MTIGIIPARYGSSRFPGKPLTLISNKPMIQWVWEAASKAKLDQVIIATDSMGIKEVCRSFGAEAMITDLRHPNGTSRCQEVIIRLRVSDYSTVVVIQGDEPLVTPDIINSLTEEINLAGHRAASVYSHFNEKEDIDDPNIVKVVVSNSMKSLYFSRMPLSGSWKHIGLYAYRREYLAMLQETSMGGLERKENLEQLRVLENDGVFSMVFTKKKLIAVDLPSDVIKVSKVLDRMLGSAVE